MTIATPVPSYYSRSRYRELMLLLDQLFTFFEKTREGGKNPSEWARLAVMLRVVTVATMLVADPPTFTRTTLPFPLSFSLSLAFYLSVSLSLFISVSLSLFIPLSLSLSISFFICFAVSLFETMSRNFLFPLIFAPKGVGGWLPWQPNWLHCGCRGNQLVNPSHLLLVAISAAFLPGCLHLMSQRASTPVCPGCFHLLKLYRPFVAHLLSFWQFINCFSSLKRFHLLSLTGKWENVKSKSHLRKF